MEKEALWRDMPSMENNFAFFEKIYALWLREFKVFLREKSRLVASTFTPLLWLFVVGIGFGSVATLPAIGSIGYQKFIFPGIVCMSIIFTSIFFGSYIIWDRKFDFLKSVMVAPVNRATIFVGKALGGMTSSLTARFGSVGEPLAHARRTDGSRDGNGAVAENRAKPRGQRTSA